jgi:Ca2+-binding RTX toxin-like protein
MGGEDSLEGNAGDDIIVGGALGGFTRADLADSTYFATFHTEWNDGAKDIISGGSGDDDFLIASTSCQIASKGDPFSRPILALTQF